MKTGKKTNLMIAFAIIFSLVITSCQKGSYSSNPAPAPAAKPAPVIGVKLSLTDKFGNILTDNNGRSLYFFSNDVAGSSTCTGNCTVAWPTFYVASPAIGSGLDASDFAVITRPDGAMQTTYKGWPLYYYANDAKAGDVTGDAVGKLWSVAKPDYALMIGNAQLVGLDTVQYNSQSLRGVEVSQYITDPYGHTLYTYTLDSSNKNTFTKADFTNNKVWPIDTVGTTLTWFPSILDKTQFTTIDVFGRTQLVYKGHPMYFFGQDAAQRGNTRGVSFPTPGAAIWKILNTTTPAL